jgi:phosphatidylglycerophosphatase GEP4
MNKLLPLQPLPTTAWYFSLPTRMGQSFNTSGVFGFFQTLLKPSHFIPSLVVKDIRQIPFENLRKTHKAIIFDKDNTLTAPYSLSIYPEFKSTWHTILKTFGSENILIVSNSVGTKDDKANDYLKIENEFGVKVLKSDFKKPSGSELAIEVLKVKGEEIVMVGDRISTDIVYGNRIGAYTILVTSIVSEKGDNYFAQKIRRIEYFLLSMYLNKKL